MTEGNSADIKSPPSLSEKPENVEMNSESTEYYEKTYVDKSTYEYSDHASKFKRFVNSFKRSEASGKDVEHTRDEYKHEQLKQTIKPRHVVMISLGTGIGTGLLVGAGKSLTQGGPAGLLMGYAIMGACVYCVIQAAGEMAVCYPALTGGFNNYPSFLIDPALGFATAWLYCLQWLCVFPLELVTAAITIRYWNTTVNADLYVSVFYVIVIVINFFGARGYAEAEFFFNTCKVLMIAVFFLVGILINTGAVGNDGYIGDRYWREAGAFGGETTLQHFKGFVATLVNAAFSLGCSEFVALTAAEQANPRKSIPSAAKKMLYKVFVVFLGSVILIGFLVPMNHEDLLGSDNTKSASPFVLAVSIHGISILPHIFNAVILLALLSVGNSAFYSSSRLLLCLSDQGYAPKIFKYIDREGRPLMAMIVSILMGCICFVAASPHRETVFSWLLAISGLSQLFTWSSICVSHIRFRRAIKVQGRSLGELGYRAQTGVAGSYFAGIILILSIIGQFWTCLSPVGGHGVDVGTFFEGYLAMPIFLMMYFGYKLWNKDWRLFIRSKDIDLVSHRKVFDEDVLKQEDVEYREKLKNSSMWYRISEFWC
ncbi:HCL637Wp [Eremothecium sinecaudum]|uniref:HCL637Wp n=1 Tax=Eremothecium sinecaudum TaxID=45286 RepID=A0A120K1L6_9SACH|nr:HCL637Wp [Eremothecium sinecaudum]AMD19514.1 HCL637Wp [Eremothecium sinecaudum]